MASVKIKGRISYCFLLRSCHKNINRAAVNNGMGNKIKKFGVLSQNDLIIGLSAGIAMLTNAMKKPTYINTYDATLRAHACVMSSVFITNQVEPSNA